MEYNYGTTQKEVLSMTILPIKELKNSARISELCNQSDEPLYITKNGYADMVVMSAAVYDAKIARMEAYEKVMAGIQNAQAGHTSDAMTFINGLGEKYGK